MDQVEHDHAQKTAPFSTSGHRQCHLSRGEISKDDIKLIWGLNEEGYAIDHRRSFDCASRLVRAYARESQEARRCLFS